MRSRGLYFAGLALGFTAVGICVVTEFGNPELTRARLLMEFWPRYLAAVALLIPGVIMASIGGEMEQRVRR